MGEPVEKALAASVTGGGNPGHQDPISPNARWCCDPLMVFDPGYMCHNSEEVREFWRGYELMCGIIAILLLLEIVAFPP